MQPYGGWLFLIRDLSESKFAVVFYSRRHLFGAVDYLSANDTRQYLYCLTPRPELYAETKVLKGVTNIGKLDIVWKTNMGEKGRLQTSQLQRVVSASCGR